MSERLLTPDEQVSDKIADALVGDGYIILSSALPEFLLTNLFDHLNSLAEADFKRAGIGRQDDFHLDSGIRRDRIHWLEENDPAGIAFLAWMEGLRVALNRRLFLNLADYECHYANYGAGAFYKKHFDAFKRPVNSLPASSQPAPINMQSRRVISTVLYLNPGWCDGDGGELLLYDEEDALLLENVAPEYGKLVIFLSEKFPHEVAVVKDERRSIAGWFRVNDLA